MALQQFFKRRFGLLPLNILMTVCDLQWRSLTVPVPKICYSGFNLLTTVLLKGMLEFVALRLELYYMIRSNCKGLPTNKER